LIKKIWLEKIHLDLTVNWKLSRNQTTFKENFIVHLSTSIGDFRSEIAPNIRYGENPDSIKEQFNLWASSVDLLALQSLSSLEESLDRSLHHSLRFGLESVVICYLAKLQNQSLTNYLGMLPSIPVMTSFSMPIMPIEEIESYLRPLKRFESLKIKVDAESAKATLKEVGRVTQVKLRVDANEGWRDLDEFMRFQESLTGMNIELIEQPFPSSADFYEAYRELKKVSPYKILADESIEDVGDFHELSQQFHAVNIKLMKTGSLIKARDLINMAHDHQMETMIGCMIETTVGISYGMLFTGMVNYVDLDGFLLIKKEPFQLVSEKEGLLELQKNSELC
jgi:L-alanine-DL-glutamate epimerase-like enolase superfamily enzyme